jgi:DNA-binding transcriptional regulator YdaS (Cro superfamily)
MIDIQAAIDAFGTQKKMAVALGVNITTLHGWVKRGAIPRWHQAKVDAAYAARIASLTAPVIPGFRPPAADTDREAEPAS